MKIKKYDSDCVDTSIFSKHTYIKHIVSFVKHQKMELGSCNIFVISCSPKAPAVRVIMRKKRRKRAETVPPSDVAPIYPICA